MTLLVVRLPWLSPPLSLNDRDHWATHAAKVQEVRDAARWVIRAARLPRLPAAEIVLCWRVRDFKRRDNDNLVATLKPCIDALVDEGVLADDNWQHVRLAAARIDPPNDERTCSLWLEISERPREAGAP